MALGDSLSRLGATGVLMARQRLELAALDFEEELLQAAWILIHALVAALFCTLLLAAIAASIVIVLWDTARITALLSITGAFAAAAGLAIWRVARVLEEKAPFMAATLAELAKDRERLTASTE
ncbi:MAG TPA: phage holin family protein [Ramlibacter sp.]|uniref:phage holin family protein n=1 Tax=Ramlibacter sp. TaxID=1917967 RepID=UPI002C725ACC|nr:phage holin family protein [Ramlibacter sp.]HVZ42857.1 phage holin family protein [Ramlibacter sp.]